MFSAGVDGARTGTEAGGGTLTSVSGATSIAGTYGTLVINPDGTYTYTVDNSLAEEIVRDDPPPLSV